MFHAFVFYCAMSCLRCLSSVFYLWAASLVRERRYYYLVQPLLCSWHALGQQTIKSAADKRRRAVLKMFWAGACSRTLAYEVRCNLIETSNCATLFLEILSCCALCFALATITLRPDHFDAIALYWQCSLGLLYEREITHHVLSAAK